MKRVYESTTIYALLVFIGFYNYYVFYSYFDIEIASFLTLGELLLSFLPFTFPILILASVFAVLYLLVIIKWAIDKNNESEKEEDGPNDFVFKLSNAPKQIISILKEKRWKLVNTYLFILIFLFQFIISLGIVVFLFLFFIHFLDRIIGMDSYFQVPIGGLFVVGLIWISIFDSFVIRAFKGHAEIKKLARVILALFLSIGLISIDNRDKALNILNGHPEFEVSFEYNNVKKETNSNLVFIGITEKYIFIRDIKLKKNQIYSIEKIDLLEMTKNLSEKSSE